MADKAPERLFKISSDALLQGTQDLENLRSAVVSAVAQGRGLHVDEKSAGALAKMAQEIGAEIVEQRIAPVTLAARKGDMAKVAADVQNDPWSLGNSEMLDFDKIPARTKAAMALGVLSGYTKAAQAPAK